MKKRIITQDLYDNIKRDLLMNSQTSVASHYGVSQATISQIARSDSILDYFTNGNVWRNSRFANLIENSGVINLSGEPQFWAIHTTLKDVPNKLLSARTGLSIEKIQKMKKADDYESYKSGGEMENKTIIEIPKSRVVRNKNGRKVRVTGNEAIKAIIEEGLRKGVSRRQIAEELNTTSATVSRLLKRSDFSHRISFEDYERMKNDPEYLKSRCWKTQKAFKTTSNFYTFSLKNYCGVSKVSWWDGRTKPKDLKIEKEPEKIQFEVMDEPVKEESVVEDKKERSEMEIPKFEEIKFQPKLIIPKEKTHSVEVYDLAKFKLKGTFILVGLVLVELFVLGLVLILK